MSKAPAMPFFVDAYLADTSHLTLEEHGAYVMLLMAMWRRDGTIPDDDKDNARILGVSRRKWLVIKERLLPFLEVYGPPNGRLLSQKRLQKEWNSCAEYRAKQREKAVVGVEVRRKHSQQLSFGHGLTHGATQSTPTGQPARSPASQPAGQPSLPNKNITSTSEPEPPAPAAETADAAAPDGATSAPLGNGTERKAAAGNGSAQAGGLEQIGEIPARLLTPTLTGKGRLIPPRVKKSEYGRRH